jgi:hypothetical protein
MSVKQSREEEAHNIIFEGSCPALSDYLRRVGADLVSFRRAVIREDTDFGYPRTIASISIKDGELSCDVKEYAPTDDELAAIKLEIAKTDFPKSINALTLDSAPLSLQQTESKNLFVFRTANGEEIKFVQQRVYRDDGTKADLPWSHWSDGKWRQIEPDGPLPLYGLEKVDGMGTIYVHEGAKAAHDLRNMTPEEWAAHPWGEQLKKGIHIGWPGGAFNANRVDWEPLKRKWRAVSVVLVCDNDIPGKDAAPTISKILQRPLQVIVFDYRFPEGFDLADAFPERDRNGKGGPWWDETNGKRIWRGPCFDNYLIPATWATKTLSAEGKGRPAHVVKKEFANEWWFVEDPLVFIHRNSVHRLRTDKRFNLAVRPFSDVANTASLMTREFSSQVDGLTYDPGRPSGLVNIDQERAINVHRPTSIKPLKGDAQIFLDFMEHVFPNEVERSVVMRWCATLIAKPERRMLYGLMLISETQGVGKTTLGESILAPLVGWDNVSVPDEQQVTESNFNPWVARKRLVLIHEIYAGESKKAYQKLKSIITDKVVCVNTKFLPEYNLPNWAHIFASSNSKQALRMAAEDRRWFIPEVTEKKKPKEYWIDFHAWLAGDGLSIIYQWAIDYVEKNGAVGPGDDAPSSSAKDEMIEDGMTEGMRAIRDLGCQLKNYKLTDGEDRDPEKGCLTLGAVGEWLKRKLESSSRFSKTENYQTIRSELEKCGLQITKAQVKIDGRSQRVVSNFDLPERPGVDDVRPYLKQPHEIEGM